MATVNSSQVEHTQDMMEFPENRYLHTSIGHLYLVTLIRWLLKKSGIRWLLITKLNL